MNELERIAGRAVNPGENLYAGLIDSLSVVEVINYVVRNTRGSSAPLDLDLLFGGKILTFEMILQAMEKSGMNELA